MKKLVALFLAAIMVLSVASLSFGEATATIRMWTFLDPTNTSNGRSIALQKMIDRFEAENPGAKVVVEPQQWDTMTGKFMAAASTGEAPDIMWCARDELFGVLNAGLLEKLSNRLCRLCSV